CFSSEGISQNRSFYLINQVKSPSRAYQIRSYALETQRNILRMVGPGDVALFWKIKGLQEGAGNMGRLKQKGHFRSWPHLSRRSPMAGVSSTAVLEAIRIQPTDRTADRPDCLLPRIQRP